MLLLWGGWGLFFCQEERSSVEGRIYGKCDVLRKKRCAGVLENQIRPFDRV